MNFFFERVAVQETYVDCCAGAEVLPDVRVRLLHGLPHRLWGDERLVPHCQGEEGLLAHTAQGGEPQGEQLHRRVSLSRKKLKVMQILFVLVLKSKINMFNHF